MTDRSNDSASWGSILAGLIIGSVIGAAVSLLFAPKPGQETREEITRRLDNLKEQIEETSKQTIETARMKIAEARADLTQAMEAGRETAAKRTAELSEQAGLND